MKKLAIVVVLTLAVALVGAMFTSPASALFGRGGGSCTVTCCAPAVCVPMCGYVCVPKCYPVFCCYPACYPCAPVCAPKKAKKMK